MILQKMQGIESRFYKESRKGKAGIRSQRKRGRMGRLEIRFSKEWRGSKEGRNRKKIWGSVALRHHVVDREASRHTTWVGWCAAPAALSRCRRSNLLSVGALRAHPTDGCRSSSGTWRVCAKPMVACGLRTTCSTASRRLHATLPLRREVGRARSARLGSRFERQRDSAAGAAHPRTHAVCVEDSRATTNAAKSHPRSF